MDISVFDIFPQSTTPPEPAPSDHTGVMNKTSQMIDSNSSIDEITCIKNKILLELKFFFIYFLIKIHVSMLHEQIIVLFFIKFIFQWHVFYPPYVI